MVKLEFSNDNVDMELRVYVKRQSDIIFVGTPQRVTQWLKDNSYVNLLGSNGEWIKVAQTKPSLMQRLISYITSLSFSRLIHSH